MSEGKTLSELFHEAFEIQSDIEISDEPTNSEKTQIEIKRGLEMLETISSNLKDLALFSANEELDEVSTIDLKYLLVPVVAGVLTISTQTPIENRLPTLVKAETLLREYLRQCRDYGVGPLSEIDHCLGRVAGEVSVNGGGRDRVVLNARRDAKIAKYKRNKDLENKLAHLKSVMDKAGDIQTIDDEVVRKYWISQMEKWVDTAVDNMETIDQEKEILSFRQNMQQNTIPAVPNVSQKNTPGTFILTRNKIQAQVFGAGYPSLPTMTVEEYFESAIAAGTLPDQASKSAGNSTEDKDSLSEEQEETELRKQRKFDDWKDTHRRGDGNRKNMG